MSTNQSRHLFLVCEILTISIDQNKFAHSSELLNELDLDPYATNVSDFVFTPKIKHVCICSSLTLSAEKHAEQDQRNSEPRLGGRRAASPDRWYVSPF